MPRRTKSNSLTANVGGRDLEWTDFGIDDIRQARFVASRYRELAARSDALYPGRCLEWAAAIERVIAELEKG